MPGYFPAAGYEAEDLHLSGDLFAIAPEGSMAVATGTGSGAVSTVYNHADPLGRASVATVSDPFLNFLGGLAFAGNDLLVSENGAEDTLFSASLATGDVTALAPAGSVANIGSIAVRPTDGGIFAVASNNPGSGAVYRFAGGAAGVFASGLGTGYLGGVTFDDAGNGFVTDTNDPFFAGNPGQVLELDPAGAFTGTTSLAGGAGAGAYAITRDANGDFFATTGGTLTRVSNGVATAFGTFDGPFPFPTDIAADPFGGVVVNGGFTGVGGLFRVRPTATAVPEPGSLALLAMAAGPLLWRRRKAR
jgi:hypothetical protein